MSLFGPDVSAWQGHAIAWDEVAKSGASFAASKCTEGSSYVDPTFSRNWEAIHNAGMIRIAYHFARCDLGTGAAAEAQWFLQHLPQLLASDIVCLDIETPTSGSGNYDQWTLQWLATVEQARGVRPLLYTGQWFAQGLGRLRDSALGSYPLWNAAYGLHQPPPYAPWSRITLWQHTNQASYPGCGLVDESLFSGSLDDLKALGLPAPKAPPPPQPAPSQSLPHFRLTVATHLRPRPQLDAMPLGPLLPAGTYVAQLPPPAGLPMETTHWIYARTGSDVHGYVYKPDLQVDPGHPGSPPRSGV